VVAPAEKEDLFDRVLNLGARPRIRRGRVPSAAGASAALLAPYMQPGMLVARVLPAGLGTSSKMHMLFMRRP
jgi:hypothetical protein